MPETSSNQTFENWKTKMIFALVLSVVSLLVSTLTSAMIVIWGTGLIESLNANNPNPPAEIAEPQQAADEDYFLQFVLVPDTCRKLHYDIDFDDTSSSAMRVVCTDRNDKRIYLVESETGGFDPAKIPGTKGIAIHFVDPSTLK